MRKIRIFEHTSLDGIIDPGPGHPYGGWTAPYRSPAGLQALLAIQGLEFDVLLGRTTYDAWSEFWPTAPKSPMADALNRATKHVVTHRPESLPWGPAKPVGPDLIAGVRALKSTPGPDLHVWGSTTLTSALLGAELVDDMVLCTYPVLVGRGKRYFADLAAPCELAFVSTHTTPTGVLLNHYRYVGPLHP